MGTIVERKATDGTPRYQAKVRLRGAPAESRTFKKLSDARAWMKVVEGDMTTGTHIKATIARRTLFSDLAKLFKTDFAPHHYRGKAWKYKLAALEDRLGDYALVAISPSVVADYRDARLKDPDPRYKKQAAAPRVSAATVKSEVDLLSKVFDVGMKEFGYPLPAGNPVLGIRKPRSGKARDRRLTAAEWARLEAACRQSLNPFLWPAVQLAVETAMRQGELLQLEWRNVDKARCLALLLDPEKIKTEEPRAVPLSSRALSALEALPHDIKGHVLPVERMTLYTAFKRACARAKLDDFTFHDLRHEALSRLAERGDLNVLEMAAVSGHKTLQMLKRYTHLQAENIARKLG